MDDVIENEDTFPLSVLPLEILSQIFKVLPLADRKCVRLTCRPWYDCCACVEITEHEKFVFRTDPGVDHITGVMLRSNYSSLNLEFQGLPVRTLPANLWKAYGLRIRELEFHMCQWDNETIRNIILHCENLTSLVITEDKRHEKRIPIAYSAPLLNDLIEKGIQRPKLHTLSIFIEYDEHESVLRKIFLIHPCIKHFAVRLYSDNSSKFLDPFSMRLDKFSNPDAQLMESLTCKIHTREGCYVDAPVHQTEQGLRLKYLWTRLTFRDENEIYNFFRWQRNLEVIRLTMTIDSDFGNSFYIILDSCPNLRELYLDTSFYMKLKPSEVSRFIASISKLKSLSFSFNLCLEDSKQVPSFCDLLRDTVQLNLMTLLDLRYIGNDSSDFCAAFMKRCTSLKHLRLDRCWDSTLQTIFQYLPELRTLVVYYMHDCTNFGLFGLTVDGKEDGYSIKRLKQLVHLELFIDGSNIWLTERTALELQLPRLEFLSLNEECCNLLSDEGLNHFASYLPELRVLHIFYVFPEDHNIEVTILLCKQLNNLHRLIFNTLKVYCDKWKKQVIESTFNACPSLRYISNHSGDAYARNPVTGMVLFKKHLKFPGNVFT